MKVVCQRELEFKGSSGAVKELLVNVYEPFEDEQPGGDWGCTFSISGAGIDVSQTMYGVDSLQALLHSVKGLEAHLLYLKRTLAAEITWLGMEDLGFFSPDPIHPGMPEGDDRKQ